MDISYIPKFIDWETISMILILFLLLEATSSDYWSRFFHNITAIDDNGDDGGDSGDGDGDDVDGRSHGDIVQGKENK